MITANEFINLNKGDEIEYRVGEEWHTTKCTCDAFYNADANEPGYEVETKDCTLSMYNDIVIKRKHVPKEFTIKITLNKDDVECLEEKFGSIDSKQDAYDVLMECIQTYLQM